MKEVDYIIVGCGLAGISFCEELRLHEKSFIVFDNQSQQASMVAAGIYNPVILKRFTPVWKAKEQLQIALAFYQRLETLLGVKLDYQIPVYRRFATVEEQNDWFNASDKPVMEDYLVAEVIKNENNAIDSPFGFGRVMQTGRVDTATLLHHYTLFLKTINSYVAKTFEVSKLSFENEDIHYEDIKSKYLVFTEGFGMVTNPYFKDLPLNVAKGEVLVIKAPDLKMDFILKSSVYVVPIGNECYVIGATYNWEDKGQEVTQKAKNELQVKVDQLIRCDYEIIEQRAGIRPTVRDRKPLVGRHSDHKNIAILNGLGTRGVMIGPYVANQLFHHLENEKILDAEIDIKRFDK